jgi:hypothetical protein
MSTLHDEQYASAIMTPPRHSVPPRAEPTPRT